VLFGERSVQSYFYKAVFLAAGVHVVDGLFDCIAYGNPSR
jgi:hypothetical protein